MAFVFIAGAVIVWIKNTGIALGPQQDAGIGEGLEPGLNHGFKRLQGLGVVVFHHRDRKARQGLHQGASQQVGHVVVPLAAAGLVKVEMEGGVKQ